MRCIDYPVIYPCFVSIFFIAKILSALKIIFEEWLSMLLLYNFFNHKWKKKCFVKTTILFICNWTKLTTATLCQSLVMKAMLVDMRHVRVCFWFLITHNTFSYIFYKSTGNCKKFEKICLIGHNGWSLRSVNCLENLIKLWFIIWCGSSHIIKSTVFSSFREVQRLKSFMAGSV